jgi:hypothetical protein
MGGDAAAFFLGLLALLVGEKHAGFKWPLLLVRPSGLRHGVRWQR